jgi:glycosyltransferase involved in cell wall biosynthesis
LAEFIRQLKNKPSLQKAMGRSGRRYLQQQFTLETIAQQYFEILSWNGSRNY